MIWTVVMHCMNASLMSQTTAASHPKKEDMMMQLVPAMSASLMLEIGTHSTTPIRTISEAIRMTSLVVIMALMLVRIHQNQNSRNVVLLLELKGIRQGTWPVPSG